VRPPIPACTYRCSRLGTQRGPARSGARSLVSVIYMYMRNLCGIFVSVKEREQRRRSLRPLRSPTGIQVMRLSLSPAFLAKLINPRTARKSHKSATPPARCVPNGRIPQVPSLARRGRFVPNRFTSHPLAPVYHLESIRSFIVPILPAGLPRGAKLASRVRVTAHDRRPLFPTNYSLPTSRPTPLHSYPESQFLRSQICPSRQNCSPSSSARLAKRR
jgi:hypothetical protein